MPTEKSKSKILNLLQVERKRLEANLAPLSASEMLLPGVVGNWTLKDVLAHLADWEAHMPAWVEAARAGDPVSEVENGLSWKQLDEFNQRIYQRHKDQSLEEVVAYFRDTHRHFMEWVEQLPDEELLGRGRYRFIGKGAVYDWLSIYAGHDRWAKTHLRKWLKERQA